MSILVCGKSLALTGPAQGAFEGVREVDGVVFGAPPPGRALLDATRISCRARGDICNASRCLGCDRFINFVPSPDRHQVTIRCYWSSDDRVADIMVRAADVLAVPPDAPVAEARMLAVEYDRQLLLVVDHGVLVGVARRRDLEWAEGEHPVSRHLTRKAWTVKPEANLSDLAVILSERGAEFALVIDERGALVGVVTREDLRDVGWDGQQPLAQAM